jgi:hypothetical protein
MTSWLVITSMRMEAIQNPMALRRQTLVVRAVDVRLNPPLPFKSLHFSPGVGER